MATIRRVVRQKGIVYRCEVSLKGYRRRSATFDKQSEAVKWGEDVEHALKNNLPLPGEELTEDDKKISAAVSDYLAFTEQKKDRARNTILTDRATGNRLIKRFGNISLRKLVREDIEDYVDDRLNEVGSASIRQDMSMLNRIYETARIKWRFKNLENPCRDVPLPSPPANRKKIVPVLAFDRLLEECRKFKNKMLYPLVLLLLNTGMRPSEAVTLRWRQISLEGQIVDLTKTKTEPRRVPLSKDCIEWMREIQDRSPENLVFLSEEAAKKDKPVRFFRRAFEQACIRAGINKPKRRDVSKKKAKDMTDDPEQTNVTLYTLHHSAATYLLQAGVDIRTVADILGHKSIQQTMKYTHLLDEHKIEAVNTSQLPWRK